MNKQEIEITEAKFKAKSQTILETSASKNIHNYYMTIKAKSRMVIQKHQTEKLVLVSIKNNAKK